MVSEHSYCISEKIPRQACPLLWKEFLAVRLNIGQLRKGNEARGRLRRSVRAGSRRNVLHLVPGTLDLEAPRGLTGRRCAGILLVERRVSKDTFSYPEPPNAA